MELRKRAGRAAAFALLLVSVPTHAAIHLSFGLYTSNKPTSMVRQFRPVLDLMEKELVEILDEPVEIRMQVAKDYSQGISHLASGKVDFSRFGPASYIEAKRANSGLRILAMEREGGDKVFYGIIAVAKDSSITTVEELRGKSFAFGNDQSTIGRYLSQQYLRNHGIFSADLSRYDYLGRHDTVGTAVGAGHFEAGALNETTFTKLVAKGVSIRELARFPNVTKPWIAREGLPERLFEGLREALLNLSDPLLHKTLKVDGFVRGDDSDFEDTRASIEKNNLFFEGASALASAEAKPTPSAAAHEPTPDSSAPVVPDEGQKGAPETAEVAAPAAQPVRSAVPGDSDKSASSSPVVSSSHGDTALDPASPALPDTQPYHAIPAQDSEPSPPDQPAVEAQDARVDTARINVAGPDAPDSPSFSIQ